MATGLTIIQQGSFTSTGVTKILNLRFDPDWMEVYNETVSYAAGAGSSAEFYWRRGMAAGLGTQYVKTAVTNALAISQVAAGAGFTLVDTSGNPLGASVATTAISNATPPVVATGSTAGLVAGDVVRIYNQLGALQLGGVDFTIGAVIANTSFTLAYMRAIVLTAQAGAYRKVKWDSPFYPRHRVISKISNAAQAIVTLTVTHSFTVGQQIRFEVPRETALAYGMVEINGLTGNIVAIGAADANGVTNTITVDIDTTAFGVFAWPLTANYPIDFPLVVPVGEDTSVSLALGGAQRPLDYNGNPIPGTQSGILADATVDTSIIGMQLAAGVNSPAGVNADVISWKAGVSFSVDPLS